MCLNKDGILGRLKKVAGTLVKEYPLVERTAGCGLRLVWHYSSISESKMPNSYISNKTPARIRLDLDPRLKQEVAELYSSLRQKVFQGRDGTWKTNTLS